MPKIEKIEAAANSAASVGLTFTQWMYADAQMNKLLTPATLLKMCAVIKAAEAMGYDNSADNRKAFWAALQELNDEKPRN